MTTTAPQSPRWLVGLLAHCTPGERHAIDRYRDSLYVAFTAVRNGQHSYSQLITHWGRVLGTLEDAANGSPPFDTYVARQHDRLAAAKTRTSVETSTPEKLLREPQKHPQDFQGDAP